jgi:hypothetical protein
MANKHHASLTKRTTYKEVSIMATQHSINEATTQRLTQDITEIATTLNSLRKLAATIDDEQNVVVEALAQKAGYLSDRCLLALGEGAVCGDFEAWSAQD